MENNLKIFKKLDTDSLLFTHIVYQIYQIIAFYSDMLNVNVYSTIFQSIQSCHDARGRYGNFSVIEIELLNCSNENKEKSEDSLTLEKEIINEHLEKSVSNNQFIPPYKYGEKKSDIVYPLYFVDISRTVKDTTIFNILYIDSPLAYQELQRIKQQEKNQNKEVENNGN